MSIRTKILVGLLLVFACLLCAINFYITENIRVSDEKSISKDLMEIESNGQFYVKQDLLINNETIDQGSFAESANNVIGDMGSTVNLMFAAYNLDGKMISSNNEAIFKYLPNDDLRPAMNGKSAYSVKTAQGKTKVSFSFPVILNGREIGIIRCLNDYTAVYAQGEKSIRLINLIILAGFLICLLFAAILSRSVITPIRRLCTNLNKTAEDIQNNRLNPEKVREHIRPKRRDEIGKLSRSVFELIDKISQQMDVINSDRNELSRVSEYRRDFYNIVTHELKTPLTSIKGYAEVARDNGFTDREFFDQAMTRIVEESDRLHAMVVTLLEASDLNSAVEMPFDRVDLARVAENVCQSMKYKADKYSRVLRFHADGEAWVLGNAEKLRQLIINLLDNAIKYATGNQPIEMNIIGQTDQAVLEVINKADGIPQGETGNFLLPFYRAADTRHEKGSVGLGLSICRQIAEKHNGGIQLKLTDDGRLKASVWFPAYRGL